MNLRVLVVFIMQFVYKMTEKVAFHRLKTIIPHELHCPSDYLRAVINFHLFQNLETERLLLRKRDNNDVDEVLVEIYSKVAVIRYTLCLHPLNP